MSVRASVIQTTKLDAVVDEQVVMCRATVRLEEAEARAAVAGKHVVRDLTARTGTLDHRAEPFPIRVAAFVVVEVTVHDLEIVVLPVEPPARPDVVMRLDVVDDD